MVSKFTQIARQIALIICYHRKYLELDVTNLYLFEMLILSSFAFKMFLQKYPT